MSTVDKLISVVGRRDADQPQYECQQCGRDYDLEHYRCPHCQAYCVERTEWVIE